jgi:hypothetical protein
MTHLINEAPITKPSINGYCNEKQGNSFKDMLLQEFRLTIFGLKEIT